MGLFSSISHALDSIRQPVETFAKDTLGFHIGGLSGVNLVNGKAPTTQTIAGDAAGLGAGMGLAGLLYGAPAAASATGPTVSAIAGPGGVGVGEPFVPTAVGGGVGDTGSTGILGSIQKFLGTGAGGGSSGASSNFGLGNLLGTGLNIYGLNQLGSAYKQLASQQANYSSLDQAQRAPYQQNLSQLVNNPQQYLTTDPFATSLAALYKNQIIPRNIAQTGNPASVLDQQGSNFVNTLAGNYNTQMGNLSGIAGFGFPQSNYAGYTAGQLGAGGAGAQFQSLGSLGNLFGNNMSGVKPTQGTSGSGLFGTMV